MRWLGEATLSKYLSGMEVGCDSKEFKCDRVCVCTWGHQKTLSPQKEKSDRAGFLGVLEDLAVDMTPTWPSHPSISAHSHCAVRAHQYTVPSASSLSQGTFWVLLFSLSLRPRVCGEGMQKWVAAGFLRLPVYFRNLNERRAYGRPRTVRWAPPYIWHGGARVMIFTELKPRILTLPPSLLGCWEIQVLEAGGR